MFASTRSRHIFVTGRQRPRRLARVASFLIGTTVVALATWGGVLVAREVTGDGTNSRVAREVNRLIDNILALDPIVTGVAAAVAGLVCLAFFVRDHN